MTSSPRPRPPQAVAEVVGRRVFRRPERDRSAGRNDGFSGLGTDGVDALRVVGGLRATDSDLEGFDSPPGPTPAALTRLLTIRLALR